MSANKYKSHILVAPEDDANRQIANGFILGPNLKVRAIQVLSVAGGKEKVLDVLKSEHAPEMRKYPKRRLLLHIDFDDRYQATFGRVKQAIAEAGLDGRIFVLGTLSEPERLKTAVGMKSYEAIGQTLAQECVDNTRGLWSHDLLKHNEPELVRMIELVKPFLFEQT